ncbi:hypothetical protein NFJ02_06g126300 [Pycnococcus provasolii]
MMATPSKIVALVGLSVVTLAVGVNAKPYGGGNGGYYGKYGGGKYGGVSDSYDDGYYKGSKYGGVSDSYDDGYYKGSKYGGYGYNAPKPKVSWWKPWSWKYAKKSYSYGDEYEYGYDNGLTKADLREAAHAYVGLTEVLKRDDFRAIPMTPGTTTTTTTTTTIPNKDPNQFQCTCGCNVGHQAFACITFIFDKDGNEVPNPDASPIQTVYQSVGYNKFISTSQTIRMQGSPVVATTRLQGTSLPHYAGGVRINTVTETSVQFTDPTDPANPERAPCTRVQKIGEVTCRGPVPVIDECELRCNKAVEDELLEENEFAHKCLVSP